LVIWESGAAEETRTPDPIITNDVLYQLSYSGTFWLPRDMARPDQCQHQKRCAFWAGGCAAVARIAPDGDVRASVLRLSRSALVPVPANVTAAKSLMYDAAISAGILYKTTKKYQLRCCSVVAPAVCRRYRQSCQGRKPAGRKAQKPGPEFGVVKGGWRMKPDLEVVQIGRSESFKAWEHGYPYHTVRWHFHPEYEIHHVVATSGHYFVGDFIGNFEPGNLVLTGPNLPHNWVSDVTVDLSLINI
jgi:hypothetical protein